MRILLVEDNRRLSESLRVTLEEDGYAVDTAYDGLDGEEMGLISSYDIIILDIMLPGKDGLEVCHELRDRRISTPILMLTARDALDDRVKGLDSGADDYLVNPSKWTSCVPASGPCCGVKAPVNRGHCKWQTWCWIRQPTPCSGMGDRSN